MLLDLVSRSSIACILLALAACGPESGPGMDGTSSATGSSSSTTDQATALEGSSSGAPASSGTVDSAAPTGWPRCSAS